MDIAGDGGTNRFLRRCEASLRGARVAAAPIIHFGRLPVARVGILVEARDGAT